MRRESELATEVRKRCEQAGADGRGGPASRTRVKEAMSDARVWEHDPGVILIYSCNQTQSDSSLDEHFREPVSSGAGGRCSFLS